MSGNGDAKSDKQVGDRVRVGVYGIGGPDYIVGVNARVFPLNRPLTPTDKIGLLGEVEVETPLFYRRGAGDLLLLLLGKALISLYS